LQPDADIDSTARVSVSELDGFVFACTSSAQDALSRVMPPGFTDFERDLLKEVIEAQRHSHKAIRTLLQGDRAASAVDALAIARLQLETLYSFCFMLEDVENVRLFLKNGWKRKFIRFLLRREEFRLLQRFDEYFSQNALPQMNTLQQLSFVTDAEKRTIEQDELDMPAGPGFVRAEIKRFPPPMGIIETIKTGSKRKMLQRLYPEYQHLCSFAHPDPEALLFRAVSDTRSRVQAVLPSEQAKEFYQREILELPIAYSAISAVQTATEVAAICPAEVDLLAKVTQAWSFLIGFALLALPVWEIRAKEVLPLVR
jgi:hypothetical protein